MITARILQRIKGKGRGAIFAPSDLLDLGSRASVDQTLSRLADQGVIRRLTRGLYDYPKISPRFGMVQPAVDDVARAIARKDRYVLARVPSGCRKPVWLVYPSPLKTRLHDGRSNADKNRGAASDPVSQCISQDADGRGADVRRGVSSAALRRQGRCDRQRYQ